MSFTIKSRLLRFQDAELYLSDRKPADLNNRDPIFNQARYVYGRSLRLRRWVILGCILELPNLITGRIMP